MALRSLCMVDWLSLTAVMTSSALHSLHRILAVSCWLCMASSVTVRPERSICRERLRTAKISLDFFGVGVCPRTMPLRCLTAATVISRWSLIGFEAPPNVFAVYGHRSAVADVVAHLRMASSKAPGSRFERMSWKVDSAGTVPHLRPSLQKAPIVSLCPSSRRAVNAAKAETPRYPAMRAATAMVRVQANP